MARVLVVDDDAAGLEIRKIVLERHGHSVIGANNPAAARAAFHENIPDAAILDLRLPDLEDGLALIREFRSASPGLRLIVLAGWSADLDGRPEATMVDELIAKPASSQRVVDAVEAGAAEP
jgi:DNA-binding NtrC family response regulator